MITTRGHAPEHVSLYCEQQGILISGDQVLPGITSNVSVLPSIPEANPLKDWIEAHDIVAQRVPDSVTVLPAHQLPFTGLHERLQQVVEHHEHRLSELLNLCDQPRTAQDLTTMLFDRKLEPFQNFLAVGECVAHLHYLRDKNKIVRTLEGVAEPTGQAHVVRMMMGHYDPADAFTLQGIFNHVKPVVFGFGAAHAGVHHTPAITIP